jgi:hypothetical protein
MKKIWEDNEDWRSRKKSVLSASSLFFYETVKIGKNLCPDILSQ